MTGELDDKVARDSAIHAIGRCWQWHVSARFVLRCAMLMALLATSGNSTFGQQPLPAATPPFHQPLILSDQAIDRVPQDFAGLPSLLNDDPYLPPLLWPI